MNDKHLPDASAENPWLPLRQLTQIGRAHV